MSKKIFITEFDKNRLQKVINEAKEFNTSKKEYLYKLEKEIEQAQIVDPKEIPQDVVTMNSKVSLRDLDTQEEMVYTLVFPSDANFSENKISVLAPVGTAILGYRVGDIIEWTIPAGTVRLRVEKILYQPEASGDFNI